MFVDFSLLVLLLIPPFKALFSSKGLLNVQECLQDRFVSLSQNLHDTIDGRNPAPVDIENIPLFTGVLYIQTVVGKGISEPSTVTYDILEGEE